MAKQKGFTMIELLVVIAVIGMIAAIALAAMSTVRARGRDAKRRADIRQLQSALDIYYSRYDRFPPELHCNDTSIGTSEGAYPTPTGTDWAADSDLRALITEGIISRIPVDPTNANPYYYWYEPDQTGQGTPPCNTNSCRYTLCANRLETTSQQYCITVQGQ